MQGIDRPCLIAGCERNANPYAGGARGWCATHYRRWHRKGDPLAGGEVIRQHATGVPCDYCAKPAVARGMCENHYRRWKRCGDPFGGHASPNGDTAAIFWSRVNKTETCWLWTGRPNNSGYGTFGSHGVGMMAHRWAWALSGKPLSPGMQLDHLCRVRLCVRPDHLEEVTAAENLARAREAKRGRVGSGRALV